MWNFLWSQASVSLRRCSCKFRDFGQYFKRKKAISMSLSISWFLTSLCDWTGEFGYDIIGASLLKIADKSTKLCGSDIMTRDTLQILERGKKYTKTILVIWDWSITYWILKLLPCKIFLVYPSSLPMKLIVIKVSWNSYVIIRWFIILPSLGRFIIDDVPHGCNIFSSENDKLQMSSNIKNLW